MQSFYYKNKLACTVAAIILVTCLIGFVGNQIYKSYQENVYDVKKCVIIDKEKQFDYELKTNDGFKVAIYGQVHSDENLSFQFMNESNNYLKLSYSKYRYTKHTRTYKDSNGKTRTEIYYSWDNVDNESINAKIAVIMNKEIDISDSKYLTTRPLKLDDSMFNKGDVFWGYWYPTTIGDFIGNIRYDFSYSPNDEIYTIATNIRDGGKIDKVSENTPKMMIVGTKDDMIKSLEAGGIITVVVTIVSMIMSGAFIFYRMYIK